jgi:hypothetical protein
MSEEEDETDLPAPATHGHARSPEEIEARKTLPGVAPAAQTHVLPARSDMLTLTIPIPDAEPATIQVPKGLTDSQFEFFQSLIAAMKPGIVGRVRLEAVGPVIAGPTEEEE